MARTLKIKGVEVLPVGTWNGLPLSRRDLEDMVDSFNATSDLLPVNVRLGHDARQAFAKALFSAEGVDTDAIAEDEHGWPGLGEVDRLYVKGTMLMADLSGVPRRLAQWIKERRYRTRSGALRHNRTVDGTVYRWMLDHVAILGADTPAVDGLADIGLSDMETLVEFNVQFSASEEDGLLLADGGRVMGAEGPDGPEDEKTALMELLAALDATMQKYEPLVFRQRGAPTVRALYRVFVSRLRETARSTIPLSAGDNTMFTLSEVKSLLALPETATSEQVVAALNTSGAETAEALFTFAAEIAIDSPDQLVGFLAGLLLCAPSDLGGIARKVVALKGGEVEPDADEDPAAETAAVPGPAGFGTKTGVNLMDQIPRGADVELSALVMRQNDRLEALEKEVRLKDVQARVLRDAEARGVQLPKPVEATLVRLAMADDTDGYNAVLGNTRSVPTAERGTAGLADGQGVSALERQIMKINNVSEADYLATRNAKTGATA